jgi:sugar phosphate isomerase/epimerase
VEKRLFGVSTHLYRGQRLTRDHLLEIAAHGFGAVELFAFPTHVDVANEANVADLQQWLAEARLVVSGIEAPGGAATVDDMAQPLLAARRIPVPVMVTPLEGTRDKQRKNIEQIAALAEPLGVRIAIDAADWSRPATLTHFVEEEIEARVGICLDMARANRDGDLVDAIETVSEHLVAMRLAIDGPIDWPSALTTVQKVGYEGPLVFRLDARGSTKETLARARAARERIERLFAA